MRRSLVAVTFILAATLGGCGERGLSPAAERGRQVYLAQCIACHNPDPTQPGPVGPPLKGSSQALLEAKLVRGTYPSGYTPKRSTRVMPPQPAAATDIPALAEYLKQ